jgi:hypothetical protein
MHVGLRYIPTSSADSPKLQLEYSNDRVMATSEDRVSTRSMP